MLTDSVENTEKFVRRVFDDSEFFEENVHRRSVVQNLSERKKLGRFTNNLLETTNSSFKPNSYFEEFPY
jgi:hypothetical protein